MAFPAQDVPHTLWIDQLFDTLAASKSGVIRRSVRDVEREIGVDMLVAEVRARGFQMIRTRKQFVIICDNAPIQIVC